MTVSLSKILFYCVQTVLSIGDIGLVINISSLWSCGCGCGVDWLCFTQTFTSSRWFFLSCPPLLSSECFWVEDYLTNLNISRRSSGLSSSFLGSTSTFLSRLSRDSARTEWLLMIHTYTRFTCGCTGHDCTLYSCTGHLDNAQHKDTIITR